MKVIHYKDIPAKHIDNDSARGVAARLAVGSEDGAKNFVLRVFELAPGGFTPRHTHDWEHELFVHSGQGEVLGEGTWHPVRPGSAVFVPAGQEHQVRNAGGDPLVFVCLIPAGPPEL